METPTIQLKKVIRSTVLGSFEVYQKTEEIISGATSDGNQTKAKLFEQSKQYRRQFTSLENEIGAIAKYIDETKMSESETIGVEREYEIIHWLHLNWHMIEVFLLNPSEFIVFDVVQWLQVCFVLF